MAELAEPVTAASNAASVRIPTARRHLARRTWLHLCVPSPLIASTLVEADPLECFDLLLPTAPMSRSSSRHRRNHNW